VREGRNPSVGRTALLVCRACLWFKQQKDGNRAREELEKRGNESQRDERVEELKCVNGRNCVCVSRTVVQGQG